PLDPLRLLHLPGRAGPLAPGFPSRPRPSRTSRPRTRSLRSPALRLARTPRRRWAPRRRAYCGCVRQGPRATGVTKVTEADDAVVATPTAEKNPGRAGWLFGAVTVLPALLAVAWLLPAFPLLLAGRLAPPPMVFMFVPLAAALCYFAVRQLPATWPAFRETRAPSSEAKASEPQAGEAKASEAKASEAKASEAKASEAKA